MRMQLLWLAVAVVLFMPVAESSAKPQNSKKGDNAARTPAPKASPPPVGSADLARPTPLPVVPYQKLMAFLPVTPSGWTAEKPSGSLNEIEVFNLSTASQTYQKGEDENAPVVTVTLIDAGGHKGYFETATVQWKVNAETPEGYDKTVEIDGMPGYEHFNKPANSSSLSVVVAKRFFIQIEVTNQDPGELREWLKKIDVKKLAELK